MAEAAPAAVDSGVLPSLCCCHAQNATAPMATTTKVLAMIVAVPRRSTSLGCAGDAVAIALGTCACVGRGIGTGTAGSAARGENAVGSYASGFGALDRSGSAGGVVASAGRTRICVASSGIRVAGTVVYAGSPVAP